MIAKGAIRRMMLNLALVAASVAFSFAALEAGLRIAGVAREEMRFTCYDPIMGNVYCPYVQGTIQAPDGLRTLRTNSDGLADRERPVRRRPGAYRIALLGDSMVAALYLDPMERISGLWERELAARLKREVEVINFAVQGTGTWEQLQMYHLKAQRYRPDLVVLAFFWGNDVWNNSARASTRAPNPLQNDYDATAWKRRIRVAQRAFSRWWWNHSAAYQFLRTGSQRVAELSRQAQARGWATVLAELRGDFGGVARLAPPQHLQPQLGMPEYDWSSADWILTRSLLAKLDEEVRADGARLVVFDFPSITHAVERLPRAKFEAFLSARGVPVFGLFDLYARQDRSAYLEQFIVGDVHWSAAGHRIAARHTLEPLAGLLAAAPPKP